MHTEMILSDLGYNGKLEEYRINQKLDIFEIGRIIAEHKERYIVMTVQGECEAEITGNMRYTGRNREDFPAVGDWVALTIYESGTAIIHKILPRTTVIKRQAIGQIGEVQIIATNIDCAFIIQAVDRDFNINRLERYLTICHSSGVSPIILLSKIDLIGEQRLSELLKDVKLRIKNVPVFAISNESGAGYDDIIPVIEKGKTYCMLGSSGVGKSSMINYLTGKKEMQTGTISQSTRKGRHVTTHRELVVLENGGIFVDNPGMREIGIADTADGLENTFDIIVSLSRHCRFKNCTHTSETGCHVLEAVEKGELDRASYENYLKMEKERAHFESTLAERRKKEKEFGKIMKNYNKNRKDNKF